jgi:hypothetical protein
MSEYDRSIFRDGKKAAPVLRPAKGQLVLIEWLDIQTDTGWSALEDDTKPALCKTVGFVTHVEAAHVTVAASMGVAEIVAGSPVETNLRQSIPWGCVTAWHRLGKR